MRKELGEIVGAASLCLVLLTASCDGQLSGSGGSSGSAGHGGGGSTAFPDGGNSGVAGSAGDSGNAGNGGAAGDAGAAGSAQGCSTLGDALRLSNLTVKGAAIGTRAITAERGDGSVVAWAANDGKVHVLALDGQDAPSGEELAVDGTQVFGAAASSDDVALLVSRPPDFMTFVRIDNAGQVLVSKDLVGGGDHATIGVEWFGEFAQTGRLVAQSDGSYAAYHALHRRWPDNIGHQGDTLRLLGKDGSPQGGGWDWGCSHSMDERLAVGPTGLVPICISDCYPSKGLWFNHNGAELTQDPAANCAGGFSTALGGLVAVADGFFLVYKDASSAAHLGHFDAQGKPIGDRALMSDQGSSRLARYQDGLLMGSPSAAGASIEQSDSMGAVIGEKLDISVALPEQDFESRSDRSVAWATISGTALTVVRVRTCP